MHFQGVPLGLTVLFLLPAALLAQGPIQALSTSDTALIGRFARGPTDFAVRVGPAEFEATFGSTNSLAWPAEIQARQFFANGGSNFFIVRISKDLPLEKALVGDAGALSGIYALEPVNNLRLLLAPELPQLSGTNFSVTLNSYREFAERRRVFLILDPPPGLANASAAVAWANGSIPTDAAFCALYFPYLQVMLQGKPAVTTASGAMAAVYATNDLSGIWHSPAGTAYPLAAQSITPAITSSDSDLLNQNNLCAIREFTGTGVIPWGARTLDRSNSDNRFIPVVRTRAWLAASIERSLAFAATADNGDPLWTQIRGLVSDFLYGLYQQGAFVGSTPSTAFFVKCDASTTTAGDIAAHRVIVQYGVALLRAGEFYITTLTLPIYDPSRSAPVTVLHALSYNGNYVISYPTESGFQYQLESCSDLSSTWTGLGPLVNGDGTWQQAAVPFGSGNMFVRVRMTPTRF